MKRSIEEIENNVKLLQEEAKVKKYRQRLLDEEQKLKPSLMGKIKEVWGKI